MLIHLGLVSLAVGIAGSALETRSRDVVLRQGETIHWENFSLRCLGLNQTDLPEKTIVSAGLEVSESDSPSLLEIRAGQSPAASPATIAPARCYYKQQRQWAGRAAIHSTWRGDLYAILRTHDDPERIGLTLVDNPRMRWLWLGGWLGAVGAIVALWPANISAFFLSVRIPSALPLQESSPRQSTPRSHP